MTLVANDICITDVCAPGVIGEVVEGGDKPIGRCSFCEDRGALIGGDDARGASEERRGCRGGLTQFAMLVLAKVLARHRPW